MQVARGQDSYILAALSIQKSKSATPSAPGSAQSRQHHVSSGSCKTADHVDGGKH